MYFENLLTKTEKAEKQGVTTTRALQNRIGELNSQKEKISKPRNTAVIKP